jgi:hypothetical protein
MVLEFACQRYADKVLNEPNKPVSKILDHLQKDPRFLELFQKMCTEWRVRQKDTKRCVKHLYHGFRSMLMDIMSQTSLSMKIIIRSMRL